MRIHAFLPFCLWDKEVLISISALNIRLLLILSLIVICAGCGTYRGNIQRKRDNRSLSYIHSTNALLWQPDWFHWSAPTTSILQPPNTQEQSEDLERSSEVLRCVRFIFLEAVGEKLVWRLCSASRLKHVVFCSTRCWRRQFAFVLSRQLFSKLSTASLSKPAIVCSKGKKNRSAVKQKSAETPAFHDWLQAFTHTLIFFLHLFHELETYHEIKGWHYEGLSITLINLMPYRLWYVLKLSIIH